MEEQIYLNVWQYVFASVCLELRNKGVLTYDIAQEAADNAAHEAVLRWDESKRLASITLKHKENP